MWKSEKTEPKETESGRNKRKLADQSRKSNIELIRDIKKQ